MIPDRVLCPRVGVVKRLGDRARPAGGRPPVVRLVYAACVLDTLEQTRALLIRHLEAVTGPLRCTDVDLEVAVGLELAGELLEDLVTNRGQDVEGLEAVTHALHQVGAVAEHAGAGAPVLVVASCGALTGQAGHAIGAS